MNSIVKKAVAALVAGSALVGIAASPASAYPGRWGGGWHGGWHGGYHHYRGGWGPGAAVGLGIAGLAVGAAIASDRPRYYEPRGYYYAPPPPPPVYYQPGYYQPGYYYGY